MDAGPLEITRRFNASRERLWQAFTDAGLLAKWWSPEGYTSDVLKLDARVGGTYHNVMHSPEGKAVYGTGEFRELRAGERLVMTDHFADAQGNVVDASTYGMGDDWPDDMTLTVTFQDELKGTVLHLTHKGIPPDQLAPCRQGWNQCLDKLEMLVDPGKPAKKPSHATAKA